MLNLFLGIKMLKQLFSIIVLGGLFLSAIVYLSAQDKPDGKQILESAKCLTCHGVASQNIEGKKKDKSVDLSNVGSTQTAESLSTYLKKESEYNGKKHPVAYKGSDDEFETLKAWLLTLKK